MALKLRIIDAKTEKEIKDEEEEKKDLDFVSGNPRVETVIGRLHLYRDAIAIVERGDLVCLIDVPPHMSPIELLDFTSPFRIDIALIRILKDPEMQRYMALLQMVNEERAVAFFSVSRVDCWRHDQTIHYPYRLIMGDSSIRWSKIAVRLYLCSPSRSKRRRIRTRKAR